MRSEAQVQDLVHDLERVVTEATTIKVEELDRDTCRHAGEVFADTIGVIAAGARAPEVRALAAEPAFQLGATGPARTLVPGARRGTPLNVAWLNGTAGTFLELDEGYRPTGHPAVQVIPAALAAAEATRANGQLLLRAILAGYEVAARLFESFALPAPMHPHGHFAALGAAAAVAVIEGEDPVAATRIAATQPLLTGWEACFAGATTRNTWSGHSNRVGVLAPMLHRAGFTGSTGSLMSVVAPFLAPTSSLAEPVRAETLRIRRNYLKLHSACALTHAALDAVLAARAQLRDPDPDLVEEVSVVTVSNNLRVARQAAPNRLSTRFSLPYAVAAALVTGDSGPASFEWRPDVAKLAQRVRVRASGALDAGWPRTAPAWVRIVSAKEAARAMVTNPRGHHDLPVGRRRLRDKFVALGGSAEAFESLADLTTVEDCSVLPLDLHPQRHVI